MAYGTREHPPEWYCGGKRRDGLPGGCRLRAGHGTSHLGYGRCKFHGGATPIKHGFYSKWVSQMLADRMADAEGLSFLEHAEQALVAQVGLIAEYMGRVEEGMPLSREDIDFMQKWLSRVTKSAEQVNKIRLQQAMTVAEARAMFEGWAQIVEKYIDDPDTKERLGRELRDYTRRGFGSRTMGAERGQDRRPALPSPEQR